MGIYIKGMEMPTNCGDCPCAHIFDSYTCRAAKRSFDKYPLENREDWCPLISVPEPHGRLIDVNKMLVELVIEGQRSKRYRLGETWELNYEEIRSVISRLPTIIPASEEGET